jgi:DNA-binding NtrC family response regulator
MTPPRIPLDPGQQHAVAYAVHILQALATANGNTGAAAEALGVSRRTLDDHIARLGLRELQTELWSRSMRQTKRTTPPTSTRSE